MNKLQLEKGDISADGGPFFDKGQQPFHCLAILIQVEMNRACRTGKGAASAAFAGLADHQPAVDQVKRVCVASLEADAAACALLPGFDAQTGETQDGIEGSGVNITQGPFEMRPARGKTTQNHRPTPARGKSSRLKTCLR